VHTQAEDRAHRMGQTDSVLCYYLVADEGSDETIQEFIGLKVAQFNGLMGEMGETNEARALAQSYVKDHMNRLIDNLKSKKSA
jgi:SWI/SNF-related matrix-associated actin-dependent regulator of chromatin subfamily A-like protein 1